MTVQLPGFQDAVHHSQHTFRALLNALARPGQIQSTAPLTPPTALAPSIAAASLTLLDLETRLWLQPGLPSESRNWLLFHTGCHFTEDPKQADFALITDLNTAPQLDAFNFGSPEYPEASTSLLIQLSGLSSGNSVRLAGPGIQGAIAVSIPIRSRFWQQWQAMTANYPLGLDIWCFAHNQVLGLPRSSRICQGRP
ncbi:MAG: phosphonate C-P lyase system protein PhnH [Cyanobacteria bacterium P01_H01_bin.119]